MVTYYNDLDQDNEHCVRCHSPLDEDTIKAYDGYICSRCNDLEQDESE